MQGGSIRNFSPAPGTGTGTAQPVIRLMGSGHLPGTHTATSLYESGSLVNSGHGTNNTGGYSLFSSSGGSTTTPFPAVGGLLNLDTSTDHMRYQAVSTGSPLSVNSDLSDQSGSLSPIQRNTHHYQSVESIGSSVAVDQGAVRDHTPGGGQSYDEWPNI